MNETILCLAPATGDSFEDCLNKIISKNVLVKDLDNQLIWYDTNETPLILYDDWTRP